MRILKRILTLLLALLLMGSFYLYALMREDEESKRSEQFIVAQDDAGSRPMGGFTGTDPAALARAMGADSPLPTVLESGQVEDASYHGQYARLLTAQGDGLYVQGVRPASAAPLLRGHDLRFTSMNNSLFSLPLMTAQDEQSRYYYLVTQDMAAFMIRVPLQEGTELLSKLQLFKPEI